MPKKSAKVDSPVEKEAVEKERAEGERIVPIEAVLGGILKQLSINNAMLAELLKRIPPVPEKRQSLSGVKAS